MRLWRIDLAKRRHSLVHQGFLFSENIELATGIRRRLAVAHRRLLPSRSRPAVDPRDGLFRRFDKGEQVQILRRDHPCPGQGLPVDDTHEATLAFVSTTRSFLSSM